MKISTKEYFLCIGLLNFYISTPESLTLEENRIKRAALTCRLSLSRPSPAAPFIDESLLLDVTPRLRAGDVLLKPPCDDL